MDRKKEDPRQESVGVGAWSARTDWTIFEEYRRHSLFLHVPLPPAARPTVHQSIFPT